MSYAPHFRVAKNIATLTPLNQENKDNIIVRKQIIEELKKIHCWMKDDNISKIKKVTELRYVWNLFIKCYKSRVLEMSYLFVLGDISLKTPSDFILAERINCLEMMSLVDFYYFPSVIPWL